MDVRDANERRLAILAQGGDGRAAGELFSLFWPRIWRAAFAVLGDRSGADDAAQSAVERAFRSLGSYDPGRPFGAWITRIAVNQALNQRRAERPHGSLDDSIGDPRSSPFQQVADRDELFLALGGLPEERRVVLALRYFLDFDPPEIAEALDLPLGTVSSRLARGLADLRHNLEVSAK